MTRLSCHRFRSHEVRLWLGVIAYNLGNLWRRLVLPLRVGHWSLTSLQQRLVKTGGRLIKHARYSWLLLAESHLTRRLFGSMVWRIAALPLPTGMGVAAGKQSTRREEGDGKVYDKSPEITGLSLFVAEAGTTDHLPGGGRVPQDGNHEGHGSDGGRRVYNECCPGVHGGNPDYPQAQPLPLDGDQPTALPYAPRHEVMNGDTKPVLVIGGGISGMTAALEAAELGYAVVLVEKEPFLGGRVLRTHRYFPKMCPPTCGFEINVRRIRQNPRITVHTMATVERIVGNPGNFMARIMLRPRYVTGKKFLDDSLIDQLTSERPNDFNLAMDKTKALYQPHDTAYPPVPVLDRETLSQGDEAVISRLFPAGAIDLNMREEEIEVEVGAIIVATGWRPYDATKLDNLGFGKFRNVITNVMMERLAAREGPTGGELNRPSDGKKAEKVAFVQCAGSRDENHLPYCSAVCCMASLKQVRYLREKNPDSRATVFYIDVRTVGRLEKFYYSMLEDEKVAFVRGKVAKITEEPVSGNLIVEVEDTVSACKLHAAFDMVVLATGVVPNTADVKIPFPLKYDAHGFIDGTTEIPGIYAAGCAKRPCDVARCTKDATGAALKAIQCLKRGE